MIATAEAAPTHDTAIEILNDVLRRDPGNAKAGRLLDKRQADLDALKAEQRRNEIAAAQQTIEEHLTRNGSTSRAPSSMRPRSLPVDGRVPALRERLQACVGRKNIDRLARGRRAGSGRFRARQPSARHRGSE